MSFSSCPFCSEQVLSVQLQRHANNHFEDQDQDQDEDISLQHIPVQIQIQPESNFISGGGFIPLLKECLESESGKSKSILSGNVNHFQSVEFEDVGWGCGYRNIQMLTSHLLFEREEETRNLLFGGIGIVPDILSLQKWLENAWENGFDIAGSNDFGQKICGKQSWIGTTECAALFRSFGLRARIVDFCSSTRDNTITNTKKKKIIGPMDKFLSNNNNNNKCSYDDKSVKGHQVLANWIWSYFSDNKSSSSSVIVTDKSPLYFQHDGHSRTIVGIQLKSLPNGIKQYNLLIFDPAHKTQVLESCLRKKVGWQRFIKRGVHTLKKLDYQLCYIDRGIADKAEMEKLKTLDSSRFEF